MINPNEYSKAVRLTEEYSLEIVKLRAEIDRLRARLYDAELLIHDALEDETEFDTDWDKAAREFLSPIDTGEQADG